MKITTFATLPLAALLSACVVGPDYVGPPAARLSPAFVRGGDVSAAAPRAAAWWTALGDPRLDALVANALAGNPRVDALLAKLRRARAAARQDRAASLPSVSGSGTYAAGRLPGDTLQGLTGTDEDVEIELYNLGLNASWEIDLFGRLARTREQSGAQAEATEAELADVQVALAADVASAYVNLRDQQARLALARDLLAIQRQRAELIAQRRLAGATTDQEVVGSRADVAQAGARVSELEADVEISLNQLAVLTGRPPGELDAVLQPVRPVPLPPAEVAVGDPAALLRRRPDVRQAERSLAAATAGIGIATSQYFPRVSFLGLLGMGGPDPADAIDPAGLVSLAAPMLSWNILDFGRVDSQVAQARAGRDEALAGYRGAVLGALEDAESALSRFGHARRAFRSAQDAAASAGRAAALSRERFGGGTINLIEDLGVRARSLEALQALSRARAGTTLSYIGVQKALGLGWTSEDQDAAPWSGASPDNGDSSVSPSSDLP